MRPQATSVCGLKLQVYEALIYVTQIARACDLLSSIDLTGIAGLQVLKLLVYEALSY